MKATNPRTGEADYEFAESSLDEVAEAAQRLRQRQEDWEAQGPEARAKVMIAMAEAVEARSAAIGEALATDTGRQAVARMEVFGFAGGLRRWAEHGPELFAGLDRERKPSATPGVEIEPSYSAYPLFGAIAPWNFPVILSHIDANAALIAGSAALVKPSEITPRWVDPMREALAAVPEFPLEYVMGGPEVGQALIEQVDYVCFTGSTGTGRKVAEAAARADPGQS